jgi:MoxR-like ATPase
VTAQSVQAEITALLARVEQVRADLNAKVIGQKPLIDDLLIAILAGGHVLLEGLPGLGKTLLVRSLAWPRGSPTG